MKSAKTEIRIPDREKVQEMVKLAEYAELGKKARIVFHDIANHMTNITLSMEYVASLLRTHIENTRPTKERINLHEEIQKICFGFKQGMETKMIQLSVDISEDLEIFGNKTAFGHIFTNLISNAIDSFDQIPNKWHRKRLVKISAQKYAKFIKVHVSDTGSGIPEDNLSKIFDEGFTTKTQGFGIGLSTTREYVESIFSGKLRVSSSPQGTKFTVRMALDQQRQPKVKSSHENPS